MDYYTILNISDDSSPEEILKAYKQYASKCYPDNPIEEIEHLSGIDHLKIWEMINEAYDVLSNPKTRETFDRYGEEGLKAGTPDSEPYVYHGNTMKTYNDTILPKSAGPKKKDEDLKVILPLDIREVYHGTVKSVQILRRKYEGDQSVLQEQRLNIPIQPGILPGTKYLFREEGDQGPNTIPADVIFVVKDIENTIFRREGSDLHMNYPVDLIDALCGFAQPLPVRTIDDRIFNIVITDVVGPNYVRRIQNEGLPLEHDNSTKGDLYIHFNIKFPSYIPLPIKKQLRKLLEKVPKEQTKI